MMIPLEERKPSELVSLPTAPQRGPGTAPTVWKGSSSVEERGQWQREEAPQKRTGVPAAAAVCEEHGHGSSPGQTLLSFGSWLTARSPSSRHPRTPSSQGLLCLHLPSLAFLVIFTCRGSSLLPPLTCKLLKAPQRS